MHQSLKAAVRFDIYSPQEIATRLMSLHLYSFSIPAFDSLIIVGTNNISEQSMAELDNKVDWFK